jgi:hypothetical protein
MDRSSDGVKRAFVTNLVKGLGLWRPAKDAYKCWTSPHWYQVAWSVPVHVVRSLPLCGNTSPDTAIGAQYTEKLEKILFTKKAYLEDSRMCLEPQVKTKAGVTIPGALKHNSLHKHSDADVLYSFHCWCASVILRGVRSLSLHPLQPRVGLLVSLRPRYDPRLFSDTHKVRSACDLSFPRLCTSNDPHVVCAGAGIHPSFIRRSQRPGKPAATA